MSEPFEIFNGTLTVDDAPVTRIFNGTYTIQNRETGEHRTFAVRTQADDASFAPGKRIVALLTGPDNHDDYTGFAFVNEWGIIVWKKKRGGDRPSAWEHYAEMIWQLAVVKNPRYEERYELLVEGRCIRCNRKLTEPLSIKTGIGPVCAGRA